MKKQIPRDNYIKLILIIVTSLIGSIILYTIYNAEVNKEPILRNKVKEIDADDVEDYISENESVLLYFGAVKDNDSEKIEKEMIKKLDLEKIDIVYVNITNLKNRKDYLKKLSNKYSTYKELTNYPSFVFIKDKKIVDVIEKDDKELIISDVIKFIETNEIKGEKNA